MCGQGTVTAAIATVSTLGTKGTKGEGRHGWLLLKLVREPVVVC